jgi:hypothetical protein
MEEKSTVWDPMIGAIVAGGALRPPIRRRVHSRRERASDYGPLPRADAGPSSGAETVTS